MKLPINTKIISALNPCKDRFDNWKRHYGKVGTIDALQFLELDKITYSDKLWVLLKLVPRDLVETFALDCVINAQDYAAAADAFAAAAAYVVDAAAYADDAAAAAAAAYYAADAFAAYAAYAAAYAADAREIERNRQLDALAYLISTWKEGAK